MKPQRTTTRLSPLDLAGRYQRLTAADAELDLDETELLAVATHYRDYGMLDEALAVSDRALERYPFAVRHYLAKAKTLCGLNLHEYALEVLDAAQVYGSGTPQIHIQRAQALAGLGERDAAFAELDALADTDDVIVKSMRSYAEATIFDQLGRHSDAYFFLERALREWGGNDEALEMLWICSELTGRHAQTEALCEDLLDGDAYNARAWYNLGHARYAMRKTDAALVAFEYAYIIDPRFEYAYREAGEICFETQQYTRGIEVYEVMMEYICCDNEVLLRLGQCYLHVDAFTQARLCINRVLGRSPDHDEALYYSGLCYAAAGEWEAAAEAYERALRHNDRDERYYASLGTAYRETGHLGHAERCFERACDTAPELSAYWMQYASFLLATGRALEALGVLDEAEAHTYGRDLAYCRVATMVAVGREAEALHALAAVLADGADDRDLLFAVAPGLRDNDLVAQVIRCFA